MLDRQEVVNAAMPQSWKLGRRCLGGLSLLDGGVPDTVGHLDQDLADSGDAPVQLPPAHDLPEVLDLEQRRCRLAVDPLELTLGLQRRVGRIPSSPTARAT